MTDHRKDCKQVIRALVVTRDGFPQAHRTLAGKTEDLRTVETIVTEIEQHLGKTQRIWVMDRVWSVGVLGLPQEVRPKYVLAARRGELTKFLRQLQSDGWHWLPENPEVSVN